VLKLARGRGPKTAGTAEDDDQSIGHWLKELKPFRIYPPATMSSPGAPWTCYGNRMNRSLNTKAFSAIAIFTVFLGALLFISAGTFNYWEGWLFLVVFATAILLNTLNLMRNDPALLERRMKSGPTAEKRVAQKIIMSCATVLYMAILVVSGIDHRLGWSHLPKVVVLLGECMIVLGFVATHLVFQENSFASSTIEIAEGQKVISTGPYRLVRHPMYCGGLVLLLGIPLALGSLWSVLIFLPLVPALMWRIVDEEKLLNKQLDGYSEYCTKVKYRLIPWLY
jgi:protein-S-isoprenylcysteine O-methyltransferase Ste14